MDFSIFYKIFSSNNFAAHFLKTRNFTVTNLKRRNSTSHASTHLIFFLMFLTISSTNFHCIWENQFSDLAYFLLDRITFIYLFILLIFRVCICHFSLSSKLSAFLKAKTSTSLGLAVLLICNLI